MGELVPEVLDELLQLAVVLGRDVVQHQLGKGQLFLVTDQILPPGSVVHILQGYPVFLGTDESVVVGILNVEVIALDLLHVDEGVVVVNPLDGGGDQIHYALQGETEGVDGTLQALEHEDTHQAADTHFTSDHGKTGGMGFRIEPVFFRLAGQNELGWRIDSQVEFLELGENLVVVDGLREVRKRRPARYRRETERELANGRRIIVRLNVFPAAGYRHAVQHLEEIKAEHPEQAVGCALFARELCPDVVGFLGLAEDVVDGGLCIEEIVHTTDITFVSQLELVLEVIETVVDRRGRKHQDLGLDTGTDHLVHQAEVTVLTRVFVIIPPGKLAAVAEVVGFVDDHEVKVAPVDFVERDAVGLATVA